MKKIIVLSALVAASAFTARAEFYVGASLTSTAADIEAAAENFSSDEMGWKAYVGWTFLDFLGAEAGYRDLGTFSEGGETERFDFDLAVIDVSARAFLPIGDHFTMGPDTAAIAARWLGVRQVVPMHWGTFPLLPGTPSDLKAHLADTGIDVLMLEPGDTAQ